MFLYETEEELMETEVTSLGLLRLQYIQEANCTYLMFAIKPHL